MHCILTHFAQAQLQLNECQLFLLLRCKNFKIMKIMCVAAQIEPNVSKSCDTTNADLSVPIGRECPCKRIMHWSFLGNSIIRVKFSPIRANLMRIIRVVLSQSIINLHSISISHNDRDQSFGFHLNSCLICL